MQNVSVITTPSGRIGYLLFNDHIATAEQALIDAVNQLNVAPGIDDLVIDLRYNGGGLLDVAGEFAYMIAGPAATAGEPFELLQFNDKHQFIKNCHQCPFATYFTIQFRGVNALNFGDYADGFSPVNTSSNPGELLPGCSVADDLNTPLGSAAEARLAAALNYRDTGTCPTPSGRNAMARGAEERLGDGLLIKSPWLQNRFLHQ